MYTIRLSNFEGPLDLLLFFIKRDELNIYDIPISRITKDFLDYTRLIQLFDLELAGDFLVMASTLMQIKTLMLLPSETVNPETGEEVRHYDFKFSNSNPDGGARSAARQLAFEFSPQPRYGADDFLLAPSNAAANALMPRRTGETTYTTAPIPADGETGTVLEWRRVSLAGMWSFPGEDASSLTVTVLEAGSERVDLVLADVVMPRMSGVELFLHARRRQPNLAAAGKKIEDCTDEERGDVQRHESSLVLWGHRAECGEHDQQQQDDQHEVKKRVNPIRGAAFQVVTVQIKR